MSDARLRWIVALTAVCAIAAVLIPPVAQPLSYHAFADRRTILGVANFFDVASNLGFLVAGVAGLVIVARRATVFEFDAERWPYAVFFVGLVLTAVGSAYYHLAPDNPRLFWDRFPITVTLMGLVISQVADRVGVRLALAVLLPALLVGAASALYWDMTERAGHGNLVPYLIVQGYAIVVVLLIAALYPSRYTRGSDLWYVVGSYVVAKLFETFDEAIFGAGHIISGHTLKHVAAAVAGVVVCVMLARRRLLTARVGGR